MIQISVDQHFQHHLWMTAGLTLVCFKLQLGAEGPCIQSPRLQYEQDDLVESFLQSREVKASFVAACTHL